MDNRVDESITLFITYLDWHFQYFLHKKWMDLMKETTDGKSSELNNIEL